MKFFADLINDLKVAADQQPQYFIHCEMENNVYSGTPEYAVEWAKGVCGPEKYILWSIPNPLKNRTMFVWFTGQTDGRQYEVSIK
jgi:hypothetical protein